MFLKMFCSTGNTVYLAANPWTPRCCGPSTPKQGPLCGPWQSDVFYLFLSHSFFILQKLPASSLPCDGPLKGEGLLHETLNKVCVTKISFFNHFFNRKIMRNPSSTRSLHAGFHALLPSNVTDAFLRTPPFQGFLELWAIHGHGHPHGPFSLFAVVWCGLLHCHWVFSPGPCGSLTWKRIPVSGLWSVNLTSLQNHVGPVPDPWNQNSWGIHPRICVSQKLPEMIGKYR